MEYLVESHLGGYYISDSDPDEITAYCESCGDSDSIILSWEAGYMMEALTNYISTLKYPIEDIKKDRQAGITKQEEIEIILSESFYDKNMIEELYEDKVILDNEYRQLLIENFKARRNQIDLVREVYQNENGKVLKRCKKK